MRPKPQVASCSLAVMRLYSGLVLVLAAGLVLAPLFHRMLHRFHLADEGGKK